MHKTIRISTAAAAASIALFGLAGCGERNDGTTVGQKIDSAVSRTGQAARDAKDTAKESTADARTSVMGAAGETKDAMTGAAGKAGTAIDDAAITARVKSGLAADKDLSALKIDVDTKAGVVTLNGTAPTSAAKGRAADIARNAKDVKSVDNKLTVQAG